MESAGPAVNEAFSDLVARAFLFLEGAGFKPITRAVRSVCYESTRVFVLIDWDSRSGELNAFVGLKPRTGKAGEQISLTDLLRMEGVSGEQNRSPYVVVNETSLSLFLERVSADMQTHATAALSGDRMYFRRLEAFRSAQSQIFMRTMELERIRAEAEQAWRERNLDSVAGLYASIANDLTASEQKRLEYAKRDSAW